ncbi:hypothetical protein FAGKG844_50135 [Frankia sp. AgKG'84/4]
MTSYICGVLPLSTGGAGCVRYGLGFLVMVLTEEIHGQRIGRHLIGR